MTNIVKRFFEKARRFTAVMLSDPTEVTWPLSMQDYKALADEGYTQCSEVYACINLKAKTCKGVPWLVYRKKGKKLTEVEDFNDPLVKLIRRPNSLQSFAKLIENLIGFYEVSGNGYLYRVGPGPTKPPQELWNLRPDRVKVIPNKFAGMDPVSHYEYTIKNKAELLKPDRNIDSSAWQIVKHIKTFHPLDDLYGLSPIRAGARVADQINEAAKLNYGLLKNGARMSGAFISKGSYDDTQAAELKRQLIENYAGSQNAGKQLLLTGDLDWKEMGIKPKDMDWIEGQKMSTRRICSIFGIAPELIGDVQNKTYNNQKEARRALYIEACMPLLDELQDEFNHWLCPLFGDDYFIAYNQDSIEAIRDENAAKWTRLLAGVNAGVITPNESRHDLGYEYIKKPVTVDPSDPDQLRLPSGKPDPSALNEPVTSPDTNAPSSGQQKPKQLTNGLEYTA
jgi:HK97 family phage portal protein